MLHQSHSSRFDHPTNVEWVVEKFKFLAVYLEVLLTVYLSITLITDKIDEQILVL